jgi:Fe2+ transport system protein FeoA
MEEIKNLSIPMTELKTGEKACVVKIKTGDRQKMRKLMAFGIIPGVNINIIQKYPAVVIQIGFTQVALDNDIASEIIVMRD